MHDTNKCLGWRYSGEKEITVCDGPGKRHSGCFGACCGALTLSQMNVDVWCGLSFFFNHAPHYV